MGNASGDAPSRRNGQAAWPYRFEAVALDRLFIDAEYQRPLTSFVEEVATNYNPAMVGCLIVSERGKGTRMAVIDGQTRSEAMRRVGESVAPCLVYTGLTRADEARLFADLQTKRRGMATYLRFRASLVAQDPEATGIAAIVEDAGFNLGLEETPNTIRAIAALERVYRRDPDLLGQILTIITDAWPDPAIEYRTAGDLIRGLGTFLTREKDVRVGQLVKALAKVTPRLLKHRANALKEGSGSTGGGNSPGYMADAILGVYLTGGK